MPVMYSFCFWFSVRLGSIIVGGVSLCGILCLLLVLWEFLAARMASEEVPPLGTKVLYARVQALVFLTICCVGLKDKAAVSENIQYWLNNNELLFLKDVVTDMRDAPQTFLTVFTSYTVIYAFSCLLLMYGAYTCNLLLMYPYMGLDLFRLVFLSINFVFAMMLVKENIYNLGLLIGCSVAGGFFLLYLFYLWFCTLSMCQIVKELENVDNLGPFQEPSPMPTYPNKVALDMDVGMGLYNNGYGAMSRPIF